MALIYITGISASGKSTLVPELKKRGYEAHDADEEGYNGFINNKTGDSILNDETIEYGSEEWYEKYSWKTIRAKVEELALSSKGRTVFLSGVSSNETDV